MGQPIAYTKAQAAESLGMSIDSFERYVQPHVRVICRGRLRLFPVKEITQWAESSAELQMEAQR